MTLVDQPELTVIQPGEGEERDLGTDRCRLQALR